MKKKTVISVVAVIMLVALTCAVLAGCNKTYKRDALANSPTGDSPVTGNGGMAVRVGDYLYFINGYAGQDAANEFGEVVKGAIMRVKFDASGNPDVSTVETVVPKNVYNTSATSSLVVRSGYIYFTTPSDKSDSDGNAKTSEMVLMRSTLDGAKTETIAEFSDYTPNYRVSANYIVYVNSASELHLIDLNAKRFTDTVIDTEVSSFTVPDYADAYNTMEDVVFYLKSAEGAYATHNIVYAYKAGGSPKAVIDGLNSYPAAELPHPGGYRISLLDVTFDGDGLRLEYTKSDSGANTKSTGVYSYLFDATLSFNSAAEVRYTTGATYTSLWYLDSENILAVDSDSIDFIFKKGDSWEIRRNLVEVSSVSILNASMTASESADVVTLRIDYINSSKVYGISLVLDKNDTANLDYDSVELLFDSKYATDWLSLDLVGNTVYFFNSDVLNNIYFVNLDEVNPRNANSRIAKRLGVFSPEDVIGMLESAETEE